MKTSRKPVKVAHRGLRPENTLYAFKKAFDAGFLAVECDVWATEDHKIIVCHDETLARTAVSAHPLLTSPIGRVQYADLASILVGDAQYSEPVPLLSALLALIPAGKVLLLEVKFKDVQFVRALAAVIEPYLDRVMVISFHPMILAALKRWLPPCRVLFLTTATPEKACFQLSTQVALTEALLLLDEARFDGLGFEYSEFMTKENVSLLPAGTLTHVWYDEKSPEKVAAILDAAEAVGIDYVNVG